jgi:hypothetical protein
MLVVMRIVGVVVMMRMVVMVMVARKRIVLVLVLDLVMVTMMLATCDLAKTRKSGPYSYRPVATRLLPR